MHARVTYVSVHPGTMAEAQRTYHDTVVPAAEMQDGFLGAMLMADESGTRGMSITLWDSHDAATAAEANGFYQEQLAKFRNAFASPPSREIYNVLMNYTAGAVERSHC
jgi:heme-degrading monooxygenase HmoA